MSEREPEPVDNDEEPDLTEDPRKQGIGKGSTETQQTDTGDDDEDE